MINALTFAEYDKKTNCAFFKRAKYALKTKSLRLLAKVGNDFLKHHYARFLVVDNHGTVIFCWTEKQALSWFPFCAPGLARVVDTRDFSVVAERRHFYV